MFGTFSRRDAEKKHHRTVMFPREDVSPTESKSESESDVFDEDMEALRLACLLTGTDPATAAAAESDSDEEGDDLELFRSVQQQFSLCQLPPSVSDSDEDDFETLRAIQRRFASYTSLNEDLLDNGIPTTASSNGYESFLDDQDTVDDNVERQFIQWHQPADSDEDGDDLELLRSVQQQFSLCQLPPSVSDSDEDDFETLRAIQRRFASYTSLNEDIVDNGIPTTASSNGYESFLDDQDTVDDNVERQFIEWHQPADSDEDGDDLELLRSVQQQFSLCQLPPSVSDSDEDDFETLRAIQRRFASYTSLNEDILDNGIPTTASSNGYESFLDDQDTVGDNVERQFIEWHQPDLSTLPLESSSFPKSARMFFEAIKNRSCQKFIRSKLIHIEARIEENKNLRERFKILKDFQTACRRLTGVAFSQKKDPCAQLISAHNAFTSNNSENSHVGNYRMALERKKWSDTEKENLGKGIKQQFQEMMLRIAGESNSIDDSILETIKHQEISLDQIREFVPKVNWDQLASMYVAGRSGAECEARWLNCEDPLINHSPWTRHEDKTLSLIIQEIGISNWFNTAASLRTNRTPFQCLARYQRSLSARILKSEWTKEEDDQLRIAVETFGESDWQAVASTLEGRVGTQCSNRWKKSLHPWRRKTGRWASDEDKRLRVAVTLFGPKNWKEIAQSVPGRTPVQCRERWVNSLDPCLKWGEWSEDEDSRLREAIVEHGYCWSKVAASVPRRTDIQCSRRWKALPPDDVPLLREAKEMRKAAIPGNFVDRESERPALGPKDFMPMATCSMPASESVNSARKCKRKRKEKEDAASSRKKKRAPKKPSSNDTSPAEGSQSSTNQHKRPNR